jgi:ABC-2 type transport system ATP-binding protein
MPAKVIVRNLLKHYGEIQAANGVSFDVRQGEIFGLLGPNGAGKTTTVECVVGLREPDEGHIEVSGIDARQYPGEVKQKIGAALQTTSLQDKITPREALKVFGSFYREKFSSQQLLDRFALADKADSAFDTLSGGQRQRLALALAFVNKPELIFLDEPTTGLDPQARRDLHADIVRMKRDGHTVLLTTHNIDEAERLCDRIAIMNQGRIVAAGTPRELIASSTAAPSVFLSTVQPIDRDLLAGLPGVQDVAIEDTGFRFSAVDVTRTLAVLMELLTARGIELAELHVQKATLEDVLIELTGRERING